MFILDDDQTEKTVGPNRNNPGLLIRLGALAGLLVIVSALSAYAFFLADRAVPDLVGKPLKEAQGLAVRSTFKVYVEKEVYHNGYAKGKIVSQRPKPREHLARGGTIKVTISKGPDLPEVTEKSVIVPNLIGFSVAEALQALEKEDLKGSYKEEYNDVVDKGIVVSQSVQAGSEAKVGEIVFFLVSLGKKDPTTSTVQTNPATMGRIICIDPGHQQKANLSLEPNGPGSTAMKEKVRGGATGVNSGTPEYKITLQIGLKLRDLLEKAGYSVVMTRETHDVDISNAERAKMANEAKADLFVRIHCDGSPDPATKGISTLYPARSQWSELTYERSKRAAQLIQTEVVKTAGRKDNGIVARSDMTGFNWAEVPAILVEAGFLSNPEEDRLLNTDEFQQKVAQGIYNGIVKYLQ